MYYVYSVVSHMYYVYSVVSHMYYVYSVVSHMYYVYSVMSHMYCVYSVILHMYYVYSVVSHMFMECLKDTKIPFKRLCVQKINNCCPGQEFVCFLNDLLHPRLFGMEQFTSSS